MAVITENMVRKALYVSGLVYLAEDQPFTAWFDVDQFAFIDTVKQQLREVNHNEYVALMEQSKSKVFTPDNQYEWSKTRNNAAKILRDEIKRFNLESIAKSMNM